jgi:hypothetical protein
MKSFDLLNWKKKQHENLFKPTSKLKITASAHKAHTLNKDFRENNSENQANPK